MEETGKNPGRTDYKRTSEINYYGKAKKEDSGRKKKAAYLTEEPRKSMTKKAK